jgi:hypothetical protein
MQTPWLPGETLVHEGAANLWRGPEAVGGRLTLTTERLIFESHGFNVQTGTTIVHRAEIIGAAPYPKKLFGFIPINNHLAVRLRDGGTLVFVVNGRARWLGLLTGA